MDMIFLLLRLPFFLLGIAGLLWVGALVAALALGLGPYAVIFVVGFWLLVLVPVNFLLAAFKNDFEHFQSFLRDSVLWVKKLVDQVWPYIRNYFTCFQILLNWLMGGTK
jgi:hypothetical protein